MKVDALDTPAVCVDADVMDNNLRRLSAYCATHSLKLRPHTKTHKIPALAKRQIGFGARGITVAKLGEAEVMADAGIEDILIAYPLFGEQKWQRMVSLNSRIQLTVAVDSLAVAEGVAQHARAAGTRIRILVEFDTGTARCGLPITEDSARVAEQIVGLAGLEFGGILVYPGHFLAPPDVREKLLAAENGKLAEIAGLLNNRGINCPIISGGSTPSAYLSHRLVGITEIRPGTYIFNDKNTVCCGGATYDDCAVSILTTVVSTSVPGRAIIDGGSKTFSGDRLLTGDKLGFGFIRECPEVFFEAMSEEHGHLSVASGAPRLRVGDRLRVVPNHVCACINMHDAIYIVQGNEVIDELKVAGRGKIR